MLSVSEASLREALDGAAVALDLPGMHRPWRPKCASTRTVFAGGYRFAASFVGMTDCRGHDMRHAGHPTQRFRPCYPAAMIPTRTA